MTEFQGRCTDIFTKLGRPGQSKAWTWLLVAEFYLVVSEQELDQSELFPKIWNRCLYPSGQVNYTVNIPSGYPVIRYGVFKFSDDPEDDPMVKVCNGFCFFPFNIFSNFFEEDMVNMFYFLFFQRISDPVQSQFQIVERKLNSGEIFHRIF